MADWKERGKVAMLWTGVPCVLAVTVCACLMLLQGREVFIDFGNKGDDTIGRLNFALDHINRPCQGSGADKADNCGTLALAGQTMVFAGNLIAQSQRVELQQSNIFGKRLPAMLDRVDDSLTNVNTATAKLPHLIDVTTDRINDLKPLEDNLAKLVADTDTNSNATFGQVKKTIDQIDAQLADPDVQKLIANSAMISGNLAASTGDFQTKFHAYLFPPPCKTFWCKLGRLWPYIRGAASMGEAAYWTRELFSGVHP